MFAAYEEFKAEVEEEEGRINHAYNDHLGFATIGVGHLMTAEEKEKFPPDVAVSDAQIDEWLDQDILNTVEGARRHFPKFDSYGKELQLGIMQWLYQLGPNAPLKFPSAKRYLNAGEYEKAADEMIYANPAQKRHSSWYNQTPARCQRQADRVRRAGLGEFKPIGVDMQEVNDLLEKVHQRLKPEMSESEVNEVQDLLLQVAGKVGESA